MAQYLGAGTAACYRGSQVYNETTPVGLHVRKVMKTWIGFYKRHRDTLIQPIVHLQRATASDWDGWLHVNPRGETEVGLAMIFNPTDRHLNGTMISLPLYYTGLEWDVGLLVDDAPVYHTRLERDYSVGVMLDMKPKSIHTIIVQRSLGSVLAAED